jgi:alpha-tubulin suppressor-like RCC1 family protein
MTGWLQTWAIVALATALWVGDAPAYAADAASMVSAGANDTCAVLAPSGRVLCWGDGTAGQLGDGTSTSSRAPAAVSIAGATAVSAGQDHTCAVVSGGGVDCWGFAPDYSFPARPSGVTPIHVKGLTGAIAVSAGAQHSCAVTTAGRVECWGVGASGELGNGARARSADPVEVSGIASATSVSAGAGHSCAVLSGGSVQCWGRGVDGELGNGASADSPTPVTVSGITSAVAVSVGTNHACALLSSGGVDCWGSGDHGQLGDGSSSASATPVAVSGLSGAVAIGAGGVHSCAVLAGGAVECWGNGGDGELGDGAGTSSATPVAVGGVSGAVAVSAGLSHTCALLSGGDVRCWGAGDHGELGDGAGRSSATPVTVAGLNLPPPVFGKSTTLQPVSGRVLVRLPGARKGVPLRAGATLPLGTTVDTTDGRVRLTSAGATGLTQAGIFRSGAFRTSQTTERSIGLTVLTLAGPLPAGCGDGAATSRKRKRKRSLWGNAKGHFRTTGRYGAATVVGTNWLVEDSCAGTLVRVAEGTVRVSDLARHTTTTVSAPHSLLIHAGAGARTTRSFAVGVERLLARLARGRTRLAGALGGALRCSQSPHAARLRVEGVIANRTAIRKQIGATPTPSARAVTVIARVRAAVGYSILADRHYRDWLAELESRHATCPLPRTKAFRAAARADRRATGAKRRLVAAFNALARRQHLRTWKATDL